MNLVDFSEVGTQIFLKVFSLVIFTYTTNCWQVRYFVWKYKDGINQKLLFGFSRKYLENT